MMGRSRYLDVANVCRPYCGTVGQIYLVAVRLLSTSALSMMNIAVAPVSAMALFAAMVSAFKYCGIGVPNMVRAVAAIEGRRRASVVWVV